MSKIAYIIDNGYLSHHGILNQKWGQKNGPPYPIKPGGHSAAEIKANPGLANKEKHKKVKIKDMSDSELKSRIERQKLEDEYIKSQGKFTKSDKRDIRMQIAKNLASNNFFSSTIKLGQDILDNTLFFWPRMAYAALSSESAKLVISAGKKVLVDSMVTSADDRAKYRHELSMKAASKKKDKKKDNEDDEEDKKE